MTAPIELRDRIKELRRVPGRELRANPLNFRKHPDQQRSALAGVLERIGIASALIARETPEGLELIDGHLRAEDYGDADWPVLVLDVTAEESKLLLATLDPLAALADQDSDALASLLAHLSDSDADLAKATLDDATLRGLAVGVEGLCDPDDVPEAGEPITEPGDIWELGSHRLICGDGRDADVLERLIGVQRVQAVFTSPPYGVGVDYGSTYVDNFDNLTETIAAIAERWAEFVVDGGFAVVNFGDIVSGKAIAGSDEPCEYPMALAYWGPFRASGWSLWSRRVWCKPISRTHSPQCISSNRGATNWEHVWTWKRPGSPVINAQISGEYASQHGWIDTTGDESPEFGKGSLHGAAMPAALPRWAIAIHTRAGDAVLEPFCGTGTTLIAAEQLGRRCYAIEISPAYCDIIVARWEKFTGKTARRI